ncbi:MAG: 2-methylcitrate synthase [Proteobacteria bacterium]|nr:2-methylcitrate synthase [Pseudomonadota bacterium]MDA0992309.1 2-methylcitrate synthase [Pseudomonadota bacterium]
MTASKKTGGLAGVTAGSTALCTVGKEGAGLTYRGYDIYDLADNASFEEVAYLLTHGKLPNPAELAAYIARLKTLRGLPEKLRQVLEMIPANAHPMDVQRTGVSFLGNIEPEGDFSNQVAVADRLLACLPSMLLYWHRFHQDRTRIETETDDDSVAGHFLHLLHDKPPSERHRKCLDTTLILYAEHEFNASTFAGRVITGTLSDMHSAITGAIGALRGPLHGGANEAAMALIEKFSSADEATAGVLGMLARKELIMGFGHRVYTTSDPRNAVNKRMSKMLANEAGDMTLYDVSEAVEKVMWDEKKLFANADFFAASVYHFMGIPTYLFTPIFVCSRITGWTAHVMEQRANNKLIRPAADYIGPGLQKFVPIDERK